MLQWTSAGAVSAPRTVQIRVQRNHPDRIQAGAPEPNRSLSPTELLANLRYFSEGMSGPRSTPCNRLVLSGIAVSRRPDLPDALSTARSLGFESIILHLSTVDLSANPHVHNVVDHLVVPIPIDHHDRENLEPFLSNCTTPWTALFRTQDETNTEPSQLLVDVLQYHPSEVILSASFPTEPNSPPPNLERMNRWLQACDAAERKRPFSWRVQGLPACYLGPHHLRTRRASNRWYVDAEHQMEAALRFFPDVTQFHKEDGCRFCTADGHCDGFFAQWAGRPEFPPMEPLD